MWPLRKGNKLTLIVVTTHCLKHPCSPTRRNPPDVPSMLHLLPRHTSCLNVCLRSNHGLRWYTYVCVDVCMWLCVFIKEDIFSKCHLYISPISKREPAIISAMPSGSGTTWISLTMAEFLPLHSITQNICMHVWPWLGACERMCVCICGVVKGSIKLSSGRVSLSSFRFFAAYV